MNEIEILTDLNQKIKASKDITYKRTFLYSAYITLLLSRRFFKLNIDIQPFISPLLNQIEPQFDLKENKTLDFKDYVYKSRSIIISRFIRILEKSNNVSIDILTNYLSEFIETNNIEVNKPQKPINNKTNKKKSKNSVDDLFNRFGRA